MRLKNLNEIFALLALILYFQSGSFGQELKIPDHKVYDSIRNYTPEKEPHLAQNQFFYDRAAQIIDDPNLTEGDKLSSIADLFLLRAYSSPNGNAALVGLVNQSAALRKTLEEHLKQEANRLISAYRAGKRPEEFFGKPAPLNFEKHFAYTRKYDDCDLKSDWNGSHTFKHEFVAPPGYVMCNVTWRIAGKRGNYTLPKLTPTHIFHWESVPSKRYRGLKMTARTDGNNEILNRVGANLKIRDIEMSYVPAEYTTEQRAQCGCYMLSTEDHTNQKPHDHENNEENLKFWHTVVYKSRGQSYAVHQWLPKVDEWTQIGTVSKNQPFSITIQSGKIVILTFTKPEDNPKISANILSKETIDTRKINGNSISRKELKKYSEKNPEEEQ